MNNPAKFDRSTIKIGSRCKVPAYILVKTEFVEVPFCYPVWVDGVLIIAHPSKTGPYSSKPWSDYLSLTCPQSGRGFSDPYKTRAEAVKAFVDRVEMLPSGGSINQRITNARAFYVNEPTPNAVLWQQIEKAGEMPKVKKRMTSVLRQTVEAMRGLPEGTLNVEVDA